MNSEKDMMLALLKKLDKMDDDSWLDTLLSRKVEEAVFHDESHDIQGHAENSKFYSVAGASDDYLYEWIDRHSPGKIILDFACGNGCCALRAAKAGAALSIGIDISAGSIRNARTLAEEAGVTSNSFFLQGDCENTGLPDNCIDVVLCAGMLHHLDLSYALPELRRIMKPGAVLLANEALNYNPVIKLYRKLTPHLRTKFEADHIISHRELDFASYFFNVSNVKYWHLFSLFAVPFRGTFLFSPLKRLLLAIDSIALRVPLVRNMAWQFTFELVKRV